MEEYIGNKLQRLQISFKEPAVFGLENQQNSVAICAYVTDVNSGVGIARLLHYVLRREKGSVMKSFFGWDLSCIIRILLKIFSLKT